MPPEPQDNNPSIKEEGYDRLLKALWAETSFLGAILTVLSWRVRVARWFVISFWINYGLLVVALFIQGVWKEVLIGTGIGVVICGPMFILLDKKTDKSLPIIGGEPVSWREHATCTVAEVIFMGFTTWVAAPCVFVTLLS